MNMKTEQIFDQLHRQLEFREKAEASIAHVETKEWTSLSPTELLHELRVHQIELEMQNEELRRAQQELEAARDRYADLYDFAPVGYFTITWGGVILECNLTGTNLLGVPRAKLINRLLAQFMGDEEKDRWHRFFCQVRQNAEKQSCETLIRRSDGSSFHAHVDCLRVELDGELPIFRIALVDITALKQAEQCLRVAAAAFETQEAILITDANKIILRANKAFGRITGYCTKEIIGQTPSFFQCDRNLHDDSLPEMLWTSIVRDGYWQGEACERRKNGEIFPVSLSVSQVLGTDGRISHYVICFSDITLQKEAEKILLNQKTSLERQIKIMHSDLGKANQETSEINTALQVMLKQQQAELSKAQFSLSQEAERTVLPFLKKLKEHTRDKNEIRLIGILEVNLKHLLDSYGVSESLPAAYMKLTPVEIQVASMIRQAMPTKVIASMLKLAPGTVNIHRKHIRKKLGLNSRSLNLTGYLMSLYDEHPIGEHNLCDED
ncbi:MAG: PAS domain S-box protein [Methylomicrobium sp.]